MDNFNTENMNDIISEKLAVLNPFRIILFGSHARGMATENSDIDLLVVLNIKGFPENFRERMENHRKVRRLLKDINALMPLDVLVFTIDEWQKFLDNGSSFAVDVVQNGRAIAWKQKFRIENNDTPVPKIHDLNRLYQLVNSLIDFSCDEDVLYDLSRLYIDSRYPAMTGLMPYGRPELSDAEEYLRFAESIFNNIFKILDN